MSGYDRRIDPVTRDYVDDDAGGFETASAAESACYHQILGELNAWAGDPEAGSLLHTVERKQNERTALAAKDAVESCLRPLIDGGLISDVVVRLDYDQRGQRVIRSYALDAEGAQIDLGDVVPFGA